MKEITVKEYLKNIQLIDAIIKKKESEITKLDAQRQNITAQMGGERVQTSPRNDQLAELTAKIVDLQNETIKELSRRYDEMWERIRVIEQVKDEKQYNLLYAVYVEDKLLKTAALEYDINYDNAKTIHGEALEYIRKNVPAPAGYKFIPKPPKQKKR